VRALAAANANAGADIIAIDGRLSGYTFTLTCG
jgi:hypothetical protein